MTLNRSDSVLPPGPFLRRGEEGHRDREIESARVARMREVWRSGHRQSLPADLFARWLHDWRFRRDLALNLGTDFFSAKMTYSGGQGFWEA